MIYAILQTEVFCDA